MALEITKVDVWAGEIADRPGGLAQAMEGLAMAGANLDAVIARRAPDRPGMGVVFLSPVKGKAVQAAARKAGLAPALNIATLRVQGPNRPGEGHRLLQAVADAGINARGVSALVSGKNFVAYVGFDSAADAAAAAKVIKAAGKTPAKKKMAAAW